MKQDTYRWCEFGYYFSVGLVLANLSRLLGFTLFYLGSVLAIAGFLFASKPANATEEQLSIRRTNGLATLLTILTFWDIALSLVFMPVALGKTIFPLWQIIVAVSSFAGGIVLWAGGRQ